MAHIREVKLMILENEDSRKGRNRKIKSKQFVTIGLIIIIVFSLVFASYFLGVFRKSLPDANPVVAFGSIVLYGGGSRVTIIFDDGSLCHIDMWVANITTDLAYKSWMNNDLTLNAAREMISLLDCPYISDGQNNFRVCFSKRVSLQEIEFNTILQSINVSGYAKFESYYVGSGLDAGFNYIRIWNETSSVLIGEYANAGPDEMHTIIDSVVTPVDDRWPQPRG